MALKSRLTWVGGFGHGADVFMCIKSKDIEAFDALCQTETDTLKRISSNKIYGRKCVGGK